MSDYFNRIMNLQVEAGIENLVKGDRLLYKYGHKVARHAAADIATEAEQEITRLRSQVKKLQGRCAELSELATDAALVLSGDVIRYHQVGYESTAEKIRRAVDESAAKARDLRLQAEAVSQCHEVAASVGNPCSHHEEMAAGADCAQQEICNAIDDYAQRLRDQAGEIERGGSDGSLSEGAIGMNEMNLRYALQRVDPLSYNNFEDLLNAMQLEGITAASVDLKPVAYKYDLATAMSDGKYVCWQSRLSEYEPRVPVGSVRNLQPLYTHPTDSGQEP